MHFPSLRPLKITNSHGFAEVPIEVEEEDQEPNFDIPQSREEKPAAYPNGPICIYESGVFLYFEPTAEQALNYDVIFNVASEVKNPFATTAHPTASVANPALKAPEYIHIPWEHNTDIVPDLYRLVQVIDDRVQQGKRVLVHCQCGVSRSASLIVAYGLYKNPGISVQEAYDAVKKRSRWIGPNMNLIMQLQEFRNGLLR
ncbi:DSPc-domain-containing protein, partial [Mytilinidion resinicola]